MFAHIVPTLLEFLIRSCHLTSTVHQNQTMFPSFAKSNLFRNRYLRRHNAWEALRDDLNNDCEKRLRAARNQFAAVICVVT